MLDDWLVLGGYEVVCVVCEIVVLDFVFVVGECDVVCVVLLFDYEVDWMIWI